MERALRVWLVVFGVVVAGIAATHLFIGQSTYLGGGEVNATMDSDLRFYNVLFAAYGLAFIWAARDIGRRARLIDILGALFFLGGLARLLGWAASGAPSTFYILMIPVELVIPVVNHLALRAVNARRVGQPSTVPSS